METNLISSLSIATKILVIKKLELEMLVTTIEEVSTLSDELICLFAEFWHIANQELMALQEVISSLEEQKKIFGKTGLSKEMKIMAKDDYLDEEQSQNN